MPVARLLVEGRLEIQVLGPLFAGRPVIDPYHSSKSSLAPRARDLRRDRGIIACYIRDRDFDYLAPDDLDQPTMDTVADGGAALAWRWCRHEFENYLIDPVIIHATFGWDRADFEAELINAARIIKHYQAARWTIGQARQVLPPHRDFPTRAVACDRDFRLPADLSQAGATAWVQAQGASFLTSVHTVLHAPALSSALAAHSARLTDPFLGDVANVLVWCSGKDLLGGLMPWLQRSHGLHPTQLRNLVRDWIVSNPDQTLVLLPEWDTFRNLLRSYP